MFIGFVVGVGLGLWFGVELIGFFVSVYVGYYFFFGVYWVFCFVVWVSCFWWKIDRCLLFLCMYDFLLVEVGLCYCS